VDTTEDLLARYPESDIHLVWSGPSKGLADAWLLVFQVPIEDCVQVNRVDTFDYAAAEYEGGVLVIYWKTTGKCEIREAIQ
jgi:hypothetical protein